MKNLGVLFCAISLVMMIGLMVVFFTEPAEAGADEKIRVKNVVKYYDDFDNYCPNLSYTRITLEPVVYNGYGHYYNYHIMGNSGHTSHSYQIVSWVTIHTTFTVASCNT